LNSEKCKKGDFRVQTKQLDEYNYFSMKNDSKKKKGKKKKDY